MSAAWLYLTVANREEAETIGRTLVEERLAACANVFGAIRSFYRWEGVLCEDDETALVVKTRCDLVRAVVARTKELHSYSCPCVVALPITDGNPEFLSWIEQETRHKPPGARAEQAMPDPDG